MDISEITFLEIDEDEKSKELIEKVLEKCFEIEKLESKKLTVNVVLTSPLNIQRINKEYRNIDKPTDVLSFPMLEKEEIESLDGSYEDILGDIVISIEQVKKQAVEYEHSFERELAYMVVHGFYHLMGYDHMTDEDKSKMRLKEENVLSKLNIKE